MEKLTFKKIVKNRKLFIEEHKEEDCYYELKPGSVLVSIPHAINQTRLGKVKYAEPGSANLGLTLKDKLNCSYIIKTKNNFDDANFDEKSHYREILKYILSVKGIQYIIDCHSLRKNRDCDINLGIRFGENIKNNTALYVKLVEKLENAGFVVKTDEPYYASTRTIAGYVSSMFDVWSIQLEINSKLTNESGNFQRFNEIVDIIASIFKNI